MLVALVLALGVGGIACCSSAGSSNLDFFASLATFAFSSRSRFYLDFGGIVKLERYGETAAGYIYTRGKQHFLYEMTINFFYVIRFMTSFFCHRAVKLPVVFNKNARATCNY